MQNGCSHRVRLCFSLYLVLAEPVSHDDEFIPTEPRNRVAGPHGGGKLTCNFLQQQIAIVVPQRIVKHFEVVQINKKYGSMVKGATAGGYRLLKAIDQQSPIGKVGERIVIREAFDFILGRFAICNILGNSDHAHYISRVIFNGKAAITNPSLPPILSPYSVFRFNFFTADLSLENLSRKVAVLDVN